MTSGILKVPAKLLFRHAERGDIVVAQPGEEEGTRDASQFGRRSGRQLPHLVELGGGGHPQLVADPLLRNLQGQERVFRDIQDDLTFQTRSDDQGPLRPKTRPP